MARAESGNGFACFDQVYLAKHRVAALLKKELEAAERVLA
jgi:hypothetical protein